MFKNCTLSSAIENNTLKISPLEPSLSLGQFKPIPFMLVADTFKSATLKLTLHKKNESTTIV